MAESITDLLNELRNLTNTLHYATGGLGGLSSALDKAASISGVFQSVEKFSAHLSGANAPQPPTNSQIANRFAEFAGIEPMDFQEKFRQSIGLSPSLDTFRNQTLGFLDQIKSQGTGAQSQLFNPLFQQFLNQGGANPLASGAAGPAGGSGGGGGGFLGNAFGAVSNTVQGIFTGDPVAIAKGIALMTIAVVEAGPAIKDFTKSVLEDQRKFAEVSGSMAMVFALQDVRDLLRDMQTGERTAQSAGRLSNAYGDLSDTTQSIEILLTDLKNEVLADFVKLINISLKPVSELAGISNDLQLIHAANQIWAAVPEALLKFLNAKNNEEVFPDDMGQFFQEIRDKEMHNRDNGKKVLDNMRDRQRKIGVNPNK